MISIRLAGAKPAGRNRFIQLVVRPAHNPQQLDSSTSVGRSSYFGVPAVGLIVLRLESSTPRRYIRVSEPHGDALKQCR